MHCALTVFFPIIIPHDFTTSHSPLSHPGLNGVNMAENPPACVQQFRDGVHGEGVCFPLFHCFFEMFVLKMPF